MKRTIAAIVMAMFVLTNTGTSFALRTPEPQGTAVAEAVGRDMTTASATGFNQLILIGDFNAKLMQLITARYRKEIEVVKTATLKEAFDILKETKDGKVPAVIIMTRPSQDPKRLIGEQAIKKFVEQVNPIGSPAIPISVIITYRAKDGWETLDVLKASSQITEFAASPLTYGEYHAMFETFDKVVNAAPAAAAPAAGEGESGAAMSGAAGTVRELREAVDDVKKELSEAKAAKRGEWSKFKAGRKTYLEEAERLIPVGQVYSIKREKIEETLRLMKKVHYDNTAIQNTEAELEVENAQAKLAKKQQALREALAPFNNISVLVVGEAIEGNIQKQIIDYLKINYNLPEYGCKIKITNKPSISQEEIEKGEYDLMVAKNNIGQYVIMASGELEQRLRKKAGEKFEELKRQILYTPGWESDFTAIERLERALERLRSV